MKRSLLMLLSIVSMVGCHEPVATEPANGGTVHIPSATEIAASREKQFAEQLPILLARNPESDAREAISKGKRYFLCNAGRGSTVPGITAEVFAQVRNNCPTQCLDGVTDALYGESHRRYLTAALDYSARWNQVMLEACR